MIRLPAFDLLAPATVEEAVELLAAHPRAVLLAGGTDIFPNMKRRQAHPDVMISLGAVDGLAGIMRERDGGVRIGAATSLRDLATSTEAPPALASAARKVASPQIRNTATVGGNLCIDTRCNYINMSPQWRAASGSCLKDGGDVCWVAPRGNACVAVSSSDLAPPAIALGAIARLAGPGGRRELPVEDLYRSDGLDHLTKARDEILVEIVVPPPEGLRATYHKLRRRGAIDFPILGVAAAIGTGAEGRVTEARIVIGAVASAPFRTPEAEASLIGKTLDPQLATEAAALASKRVRPLDNTDLGSRYRKWMASVYVERALRELME